MTTPNLQLPEVPIAIQEASEEINEGFLRLDAIVQLSVLDKDLESPPAASIQGDRYIVSGAGIGPWLNWGRSIAFMSPDGWRRYVPRPGWVAKVLDEEATYTYNGSSWIQDSGGASGAPLTPDTAPETPDDMDDEFEEASLNARWSWLDQGTAQAVMTQGSLQLLSPNEAPFHLRGIEQAISGPGKWRGKFSGVTAGGSNLGALAFRNTANSRIVIFSVTRVGGTVAVDNANSTSSYNGGVVSAASRGAWAAPADTGWLYAEIEDDGTNLIGRFSHTGIEGTFVNFFSVTRASFVGAPDRVCLLVNSQNGVAMLLCDWFRRIA